MSTILDVLRKVAEENRARTSDARSRLLFSPTWQKARPLRRLRVRWFVSTGLILVGFAAGAGLMFWGPRSPVPEEGRGAEERSAGKGADTGAQVPVPPLARAPGEPPPTPAPTPAELPPVPPIAAMPPASAALPAQFTPPIPALTPEKAQATAAQGESIVQRSPFVSAAPTGQGIAATSKPTPAAAPTPSGTQSGTLYEVHVPTGTTSVIESPSPAQAGATLSFLQWSSDPDKRIAFIKVNGGPLTLTHEGDTVGGYTVVQIRPDAVDLRSGETHLTLRAR